MNIPLLITYILSILIMIGLPVGVAVFVVKKFKQSWWVVLTGVGTFIAGVVLHVLVQNQVFSLFNTGKLPVPSAQWQPLLVAGVVGLLAGLFEELARLGGFLILRKKAEKFSSSLALGAGHGGIESILMAVWPWWPLFAGVLISIINLVFYNPGAQLAKGISTEEVQYVMAQIQSFWTTPWHFGLLPGVERIITISTQILLSIMVWKAVAYRSAIWFFAAFLYHAVIDALAVFLSQIGWNYWAVEGVLVIFFLLNIYLIYRFWKEETEVEKELEETEDEDDEEDEEDEDDEDDEEDEDEDDEEDADEDELEEK